MPSMRWQLMTRSQLVWAQNCGSGVVAIAIAGHLIGKITTPAREQHQRCFGQYLTAPVLGGPDSEKPARTQGLPSHPAGHRRGDRPSRDEHGNEHRWVAAGPLRACRAGCGHRPPRRVPIRAARPRTLRPGSSCSPSMRGPGRFLLAPAAGRVPGPVGRGNRRAGRLQHARGSGCVRVRPGWRGLLGRLQPVTQPDSGRKGDAGRRCRRGSAPEDAVPLDLIRRRGSPTLSRGSTSPVSGVRHCPPGTGCSPVFQSPASPWR